MVCMLRMHACNALQAGHFRLIGTTKLKISDSLGNSAALLAKQAVLSFAKLIVACIACMGQVLHCS